MRRIFWFVMGFVLAFVIVYGLLAVSRPVEGVTTIRLARCALDVFDRTLQPVVTVALACPGEDYMRIWPLPVVQPWWEERPEYFDQQAKKELLNLGIEMDTFQLWTGRLSCFMNGAIGMEDKEWL